MRNDSCCIQDICENNGTLDRVSVNCICADGFTGKRCETKIDPCNRILCNNNGEFDNDSVDCICKEGFTGNTYETGKNKMELLLHK